jgi:hypothetical protein
MDPATAGVRSAAVARVWLSLPELSPRRLLRGTGASSGSTCSPVTPYLGHHRQCRNEDTPRFSSTMAYLACDLSVLFSAAGGAREKNREMSIAPPCI